MAQRTSSARRHTSQRTLLGLTQQAFWEACRDGDLETVRSMTAWSETEEEAVKSALDNTWLTKSTSSTVPTPTASERFLQQAKYQRMLESPTRADIPDVDFRMDTPNAWYYGAEGAHTCMHIACICGRELVVAHLLHCGASIAASTDTGATPLHLAVRFNQCEVAATLLRSGADLNAQDNHGSTPEQAAVSHAMRSTIRSHLAAVRLCRLADG